MFDTIINGMGTGIAIGMVVGIMTGPLVTLSFGIMMRAFVPGFG